MSKSKRLRTRDRRVMTLLNRELSRLLGTKLACIGQPTVTDLSPRQRDVLFCLMEGDAEKQVALRLNISPYTVHVRGTKGSGLSVKEA